MTFDFKALSFVTLSVVTFLSFVTLSFVTLSVVTFEALSFVEDGNSDGNSGSNTVDGNSDGNSVEVVGNSKSFNLWVMAFPTFRELEMQMFEMVCWLVSKRAHNLGIEH